MLLTEPLISCPCCVFGVHFYAERPSHDPSSMLLLREGGCWPKSRDTWPHPSSPQYGAAVLSPLQKSTPKAWCFHPHASRLVWCSWDCTHPSSSSKHGEWSLYQKVIFSSRWSLANFRWAWTCAGLSRGILRALQDFNSWRCSVLLMVTVETVVPALFRSLTRSSRVVLRLILHLSQDHWHSTRRDLAWSPSPREIDSHLEFIQFSNNCAYSCCLLIKLFAYCPVAHPNFVQVYNFVPSVFRQRFGLAHSGEVGV